MSVTSDYYSILLSPHISEKSTMVGDKYNQYVFRVQPLANKKQIKHAVEKLFKVEVESVRTVNTKPEMKRNNRGLAKKKGFKKAYVSVKTGQEINFNLAD